MSVTLNKSVVVSPAVEAVTANTFELVDVQENYGYSSGERRGAGRGRENSVQATIAFPTEPTTYRTLNVWEDDAYLAVRGSWTDETLKAKIKQILESE